MVEDDGRKTVSTVRRRAAVTARSATGESEAARQFSAAVAHHRAGRLGPAVEAYGVALALAPTNIDIHNHLGVALRALGKPEAAAACYRRAIALQPRNGGLRSNLGNVYRDLGRLDEAAASHREALRLDPDSAESSYNLGIALRDMGHLGEARAAFDAALARNPQNPDYRFDRAIGLLLQGDLGLGFAEYEWRWRLARVLQRRYAKPRWDGSPLAGRRILLHQEQGFGDTIQFVRYAPTVKARGGTVVVECRPELARLIATAPGVDRVAIVGAAQPEVDLVAPILSLAAIFKTTLATIPAHVPYLAKPEIHAFRLAKPAGVRLAVGVVWAGRPTHGNDARRSMPFALLLELAARPDVRLYSLQKDGTSAIAEAGAQALVTDLGPRLGDFADTAAVLAELDLVITVDTAVAHLAGAMGRPVWVMLPHAPDWRWILGRDDTPWYPTMRLFRQATPGDWAGVVARIRTGLDERLAQPEATRR